MLITKSPDGPNFRGGIQSGQIWSNEEKKGSSHTYVVFGMQKTRFGWNLKNFWTHQKNASFGGSFWGTKICHMNQKGGRCASRMSDKYKKLGLVGIQAAVLWDVLITNFRKKHKSRRLKSRVGTFLPKWNIPSGRNNFLPSGRNKFLPFLPEEMEETKKLW